MFGKWIWLDNVEHVYVSNQTHSVDFFGEFVNTILKSIKILEMIFENVLQDSRT